MALLHSGNTLSSIIDTSAPLNQQLDQFIIAAVDSGLYIPNDTSGVYTYPAGMIGLAKYYELPYSPPDDSPNPTVGSELQGLNTLYNELKANTPVIVDVNQQLGKTKNAAHFDLVTGMYASPTDHTITIYYNDPWNDAQNQPGPWKDFWTSWSGNKDPGGQGWWMTIN